MTDFITFVQNIDPGWYRIIGFLGIVFLALFLTLMFPTMVAFKRKHPDRYNILCLNLLLGATGAVWLYCLFWATDRLPQHNEGTEDDDEIPGGRIYTRR